MSHDADTPDQFYALLKKADVSFVDFHATWCGPCKAIAPYVTQQCQEKGINLIKVDVDKNGEISSKYQIQAMPTLMAIKSDGSIVKQVVGGGQANVNTILGSCK